MPRSNPTFLRNIYRILGEVADTALNTPMVDEVVATLVATCEKMKVNHDKFDSWSSLAMHLGKKGKPIEWAPGTHVECEPTDGMWAGVIIRRVNEKEFMVREVVSAKDEPKKWRVHQDDIVYSDIPF